jgi:signal peptidase II
MMLAGTAFLAAGGAAIVGDQGSKALMGRLLRQGRVRVATGGPGFTWTRNRRGSAVALPLRWTVLVWIAAFGGAALVVALAPSVGIGAAVGLGLAVGGAAGNLADRLARGAVVDFIALWSWPPFNLADAAMLVGWALLAGSLV